MSEKYNSIRWFLRELPTLTESGVIEKETMLKLREHYLERLSHRPEKHKYFILMMGIVGAFLVAAGAILAINYNWDMFTNFKRVIICSIPLFCGFIWGVVALCRNNNRSEREGAAALCAAGIVTLTAMLSQIYHTGGSFQEFMIYVLALSLPLVYIFNAMGLATVYVLGLFCIIDYTTNDLWYAFGIVAFLPYLLYHLFTATKYRPWARYLTCILAIFGMVSCSKLNVMFSCFSVATLGLLAGRELYEKRIKTRRNPWMIPSFFFMLILLCIMSVDGAHLYLAGSRKGNEVAAYWIFNGITLLMMLVSYMRRRLDIERFMSGLWLLFLVPGFFSFGSVVSGYVDSIALVYAVIFGILLLCRGFRRNHISIFNGGLLLITSQFATHFFTTDIGLLYKASGFIIIGLGFIAANIFFSRKAAKGGIQ